MCTGIEVLQPTWRKPTSFPFSMIAFTPPLLNPNVVSEWISVIGYIHHRRLHRLIVGLDVEWRPNTAYYHNPIATLQFCVGHHCLIYQLIHTPKIPDSLFDFLSDENYTFVGVGIESDLEKLEHDYGLVSNGNVVDLRFLAAQVYGRRNLQSARLKTLARVVMETELEKSNWVTRSRWDHRYLTDEQVKYACVDAFVSFEIGRILNASAGAKVSALHYCHQIKPWDVHELISVSLGFVNVHLDPPREQFNRGGGGV